MMKEAVRLVIWDLDETFWEGTLVEGGVNEQKHYADTVRELARRGIMSSICSKNEFSSAQEILQRLGIWDYFIFPSISWDSKGLRVKNILEQVKLRPASVMFIDDNPMNLREVASVVPDIQTESEGFLPHLLDDPRFAGKDDHNLKRLADYKLLEEKSEALEAQGGDTHAFLRESGITVEFEYDLESHIDRVIELINRTNQLNYTKIRLPDNREEAIRQITPQLQHFSTHAGLVRVRDRFGDYGYVGFFLQDRAAQCDRLVHFCFSCRTLGMYIESWVYQHLGRPDIHIVGDVLTDLNDPSINPDWISFYKSGSEESGQQNSRTKKILMCGGCDLNAIEHYVRGAYENVELFVNTSRNYEEIRRDHSSIVRRVIEGVAEQDKIFLTQVGYRDEDFQFGLSPQQADVAVFSFWGDMFYQLYQVGGAEQYIMPYAPSSFGHANIETVYELELWARGVNPPCIENFRFAKANLRYYGRIEGEMFRQNVLSIFQAFRPGTKIFMMSAPEWVPPEWEFTLERHRKLNEWQQELAQEFPDASVIRIEDFLEDRSEIVASTHFVRKVYQRIGSHLCQFAQD